MLQSAESKKKSAGSRNRKDCRGSALVLTMFIMAGMLIVAMSSAYIALLGIKSGGTQSQSTKAYFAAEAGAEQLIWEVKQNYLNPVLDRNRVILSGTVASSSYKVYFTSKFPEMVFTSIGESSNTRRSVEIKFAG